LRTLRGGDRATLGTIERNETAMAPADNLETAKIETYGSFVSLLKWTVPTVAIVGLIVIFLIS
jgi:hypothetical protein